MYNKLLYVMNGNMDYRPVWLWIIVITVATCGFFQLRQVVLKRNVKSVMALNEIVLICI